jgi:hypothetical protein
MTLFWFAEPSDAEADPNGAAASRSTPSSGEAPAKQQPPGGDQPANEEAEEEEEGNPILADMLPWAISVLFHAGIVLLTSFIIWSTQGPEKEKEIVPSAQLGENPKAELETAETETETESSQSETESTESSSSLDSPIDTSSSLIGATSASGTQSPLGVGTGSGSGTGFMGSEIGGNVTRLVFLIDASGSLIDSLPYVIDELKGTIQDLDPKQQFTVIFFRGKELFDSPVIEVPVPKRGLKNATSRVKQQVNQWMTLGNGNIEPGGQAPPIEAITRALRYEPELIVLLSDDITGSGVYQIDQQKLLQQIKEVNTGNTVINTIQFLYRDKLSQVPGKKGTLKLIAEQTGGKWKFVDEQEVDQ